MTQSREILCVKMTQKRQKFLKIKFKFPPAVSSTRRFGVNFYNFN